MPEIPTATADSANMGAGFMRNLKTTGMAAGAKSGLEVMKGTRMELKDKVAIITGSARGIHS